MKLNLGTTIKTLRRRDGRTQESLANTLGVTAQAVSRWEMGGAYPDIELLPAIANVFGITLDELFGCEGERQAKIAALLSQVDALDRRNMRDDTTIDECLSLLRQGLAEFPGNERIMHRLAHILAEAGWLRHHEWMHYGEDGHITYCFDHHRKNEYWAEAMRLFETLIEESDDRTLVTDATCQLILLCRCVGETDRAVSLAEQLPPLECCREIRLAEATDGRRQGVYLGDALLKLAYEFAEQLMYALVNRETHYETDMPIEKIRGAIALFLLLCDDGSCGEYHNEIANLYLYLSRVQWERGYRDDAFVSLDEALRHARAFDALASAPDPHFTAPLVAGVVCDTQRWNPGDKAKHLPDEWPMWCNPDYSRIKAEITADPRWAAWTARTQA